MAVLIACPDNDPDRPIYGWLASALNNKLLRPATLEELAASLKDVDLGSGTGIFADSSLGDVFVTGETLDGETEAREFIACNNLAIA